MRVLLITMIAVCACESGGVEAPVDAAVAPDMACRPTERDKVDVLFMMDDSGSTSQYHAALAQRFPDFIKQLDGFATDGHAASYHFGVVTSDLGAPGISCGKNRGAKLQQVGAAASPGCLGPVGQRYLVYDQRTGESNVPAGQDLTTTFGCMVAVGDKGCGFEAPLEAVYRALHDPIPENQGFLRPDALLVVFLLTDEDDCSVDPTSDLFTPNPAYGPLTSFRCTRFGIFCDGAMVLDTPQSYSSCRPATPAEGGKLTDLEKYIAFFTRPHSQGGVKDDTRDVVVAAITGPSSPFSTASAMDSAVCGTSTSCTVLDHSCAAPVSAGFFADPAVRINALVEAVPHHARTSICETDYQSALQGLAQLIDDARVDGVCAP